MNVDMQKRFREEMKAIGLWDGKAAGAAFDLSAYFFARSVHLYMRRSGRIAFVMPHAAITRKAYRSFLRGSFAVCGCRELHIRFCEAWALPAAVKPLFPVPAAVLFAERASSPEALPQNVRVFAGHLCRRDADRVEAERALSERYEPWPTNEKAAAGSPYRGRFRAGAKLDPRRLVLVERILKVGLIPASGAIPLVRGRTGNLDKKPWREVEPPRRPVETEFVYPIYLGESIGPYRTLQPVEAVIPWDCEKGGLMDANAARGRGWPRLADWLDDVERLWQLHGKGTRTFTEKIDFYRQLSAQFPINRLRVAYSASGTTAAAAIIRAATSLIDYRLYWLATQSEDEACYLAAVLNSATVGAAVVAWQSQGQWGPRDFDTVMFNLPIPIFEKEAPLHRRLAAAARRAEAVATEVPLIEGEHFVRSRQRIRDALRADGIADEIDRLVGRLLP